MIKDYFEEKLVLKQQNRFYRFLIFILILAVILETAVTFFAVKYQRTVIIPAGLSQSVEVSDYHYDDRYIQEMVKYVTYLALCYNPQTIDSQFSSLLSLFSPDRYPSYKSIFLRIADNAKIANVSSFYQVTGMKINRNTNTVLVSGVLQQWTQDKKFVTDEVRHYIIRFRINYGKFILLDFQECKENCEALIQPQRTTK